MQEGWARDAIFSAFPGVAISAEFIMDEVGKAFGISRKMILDKTREEPFATARAVAYYFVRRFIGLSYPAMGRIFSREHSVVRAGVVSIRNRIDDNERFRSVIERLELDLLAAARAADPGAAEAYNGRGDAPQT